MQIRPTHGGDPPSLTVASKVNTPPANPPANFPKGWLWLVNTLTGTTIHLVLARTPEGTLHRVGFWECSLPVVVCMQGFMSIMTGSDTSAIAQLALVVSSFRLDLAARTTGFSPCIELSDDFAYDSPPFVEFQLDRMAKRTFCLPVRGCLGCR